MTMYDIKAGLPLAVTLVGTCLSTAQLFSHTPGVIPFFQIVAGVIAGMVTALFGISGFYKAAEVVSKKWLDQGRDGARFWAVLSSGACGVLAPLQARLGFVKDCFFVAHPAFLGFSVGLNWTNLVLLPFIYGGLP